MISSPAATPRHRPVEVPGVLAAGGRRGAGIHESFLHKNMHMKILYIISPSLSVYTRTLIIYYPPYGRERAFECYQRKVIIMYRENRNDTTHVLKTKT